MNLKNLIISVVFILIGALLIVYALSRPCDVAPMTQTVQGQTVTIEQSSQMDRLMCTSSDYYALISLLIGTAMIFPGISGLHKSLTTESSDAKKAKKSKK
jgi:uncharacterized membrane protein